MQPERHTTWCLAFHHPCMTSACVGRSHCCAACLPAALCTSPSGFSEGCRSAMLNVCAQGFHHLGPASRMQSSGCSAACRRDMGRITAQRHCARGARSCCGIPASTTAKRADQLTMAAGLSRRKQLLGGLCHA